MPNHPVSEEIFPDIKPKPDLVQAEALEYPHSEMEKSCSSSAVTQRLPMSSWQSCALLGVTVGLWAQIPSAGGGHWCYCWGAHHKGRVSVLQWLPPKFLYVRATCMVHLQDSAEL